MTTTALGSLDADAFVLASFELNDVLPWVPRTVAKNRRNAYAQTMRKTIHSYARMLTKEIREQDFSPQQLDSAIAHVQKEHPDLTLSPEARERLFTQETLALNTKTSPKRRQRKVTTEALAAWSNHPGRADQPLSMADAATHFGVSRETIRRRLKEVAESTQKRFQAKPRSREK